MQVLVPPEVRSRHPARFNPGPAAPAASTAPKLRDRMREQIRLEGKSPNTAAVYWHWTKGYIRFHGLAHPQDLGADDVRRYLNHLVNDRQVSKNTHGQALHALLYLYRRVLGLQLPWLDDLHAPKPSQRLPVVLNEAEVRRLWPHLQGTPGLICKLMYGTGLRIMEALRLRVHDIDLEDAKITVRGGKGDKDRVTMVPQALLPALREQLAHRTAQHVDDIASGHADVELPDAIHRKYPHAARSIGWQWFFATADYNNGPEGQIRRHHVHDSTVQKHLKNPHDPGASRPCQRRDDDDLHPRPQPRWPRRSQPAGRGGAGRLMHSLVLSPTELRALTGYARPGDQVSELHRQGFTRARRARDGSVILERAHYEAVCSGQVSAPRPKVRAPEAPRSRTPALRPVA